MPSGFIICIAPKWYILNQLGLSFLLQQFRSHHPHHFWDANMNPYICTKLKRKRHVCILIGRDVDFWMNETVNEYVFCWETETGWSPFKPSFGVNRKPSLQQKAKLVSGTSINKYSGECKISVCFEEEWSCFFWSWTLLWGSTQSLRLLTYQKVA